MKSILASLILVLVAYAQAAGAQEWQVWQNTQNNLDSQTRIVQTNWVIGGAQGSAQLVGYISLETTQEADSLAFEQSQNFGVGIVQQLAPSIFTQWSIEPKQGELMEAAQSKWQVFVNF
ncbi:MAG: hypothetical protein HWE18_03445 [Gammaproteobacteria bacterium]|nr:hypothetical protein [Gammaproteobacteria bacterium]